MSDILYSSLDTCIFRASINNNLKHVQPYFNLTERTYSPKTLNKSCFFARMVSPFALPHFGANTKTNLREIMFQCLSIRSLCSIYHKRLLTFRVENGQATIGLGQKYYIFAIRLLRKISHLAVCIFVVESRSWLPLELH